MTNSFIETQAHRKWKILTTVTPLPGVKDSIDQMGVGNLHKRICKFLVAARVCITI